LAIWSIPGFIGAALWWAMLKRSPADDIAVTQKKQSIALPWRSSKAWLVMIFFGLQSVTFYVVLAWLAPMYVELGWSASQAGALLSYWIGAQVTFILIVSRFASRSRDRRPWLVACGAAASIAMIGFSFAPLMAPWAWVLLLGFASGGWFPLAMTLPLDYSNTPSETSSWTAMMLFGGYLISATRLQVGRAIAAVATPQSLRQWQCCRCALLCWRLSCDRADLIGSFCIGNRPMAGSYR
jgi:CP family cyanate transporter-like MFS transporter